ncbi:MAG: hypothetical protein JWP09_519 [Candidatus Taylorbacteria bacterium]|nr:hypothetical protein [Candidatus Taylorbacteria bacterium]
MKNLNVWFLIAIAVAVAVAGNSVASIWANKEDKWTSPWFFLLLLVSPLVFITFGLVTPKLGLAGTSGVIDTLLTVSTIVIGLFFFGEWSTLTLYKGLGLLLCVSGIILMHVEK